MGNCIENDGFKDISDSCFKLFKIFCTSPSSQNVVVNPVAIYSILAALCEGLSGEAKTEVMNFLGLKDEEHLLNPGVIADIQAYS